MSTLNGILIADRKAEISAGAAFLLRAESPVSELVRLDDRTEVEVAKGGTYVVSRLCGVHSASDGFAQGLSVVQRGLDLLSVLGRADLVTRDTDEECLVWWREEGEQVLRIVTTATLTATANPVTLVARNKDGNILEPKPPKPTCHPAFRYYRLAQVTDDLQDAYRNMYLAFESMLSSTHPKRKEQEIYWLERALREAEPALHLSNLVAETGEQYLTVIINTIYKNARLPLFHAKEGRDYYLPHTSAEDRHSIASALALLTRIVLRMNETWFQARRMGGAVYKRWFYENMKASFDGAEMYISDDRSPFDAEEENLEHQRFRTALRVAASLSPESLQSEGPALFAEVSVRDEISMDVARIDVVRGESPMFAHQIEEPLIISEVDHLQVVMKSRLVNTRQPRSLFKH